MRFPDVSVVLPTHNGKKGLVASVDSVLAQERVDVEVIIVDDNSGTETAAICARLAKCDNRIVVVRNESNLGAAESRNVGVELARADVVAFMDDDDYWYPEKLSRQLCELNNDERVGLVGCGRYQRFTDDDVGYVSIPRKEEFSYEELLIENWLGGTSSVIVRKVAFLEVGGFRKQFPAREEYDLWLRISRYWKVRVVRALLMEYRHALGRERISSDVQRYVRGSELLNELHVDSIQALSNTLRRRRMAAQYQFIAAQAIKVNSRWLSFKYSLRAFVLSPSIRSASGAVIAPFGYRAAVRIRSWISG